MERELWARLYAAIAEVDQGAVGPRFTYSDADIARTYLWAALHDRPTSWAGRPQSWPDDLRPARLPSPATMSRRLRTEPVGRLLTAAEAPLRGDPAAGLVKALDGKPLPVGGHSTDPEARWGRGVRGWAKGYRLMAIWGPGPLPVAWSVAAMDRPEPIAARDLIPALAGGGGYLVADSAFDSNVLHELAAAAGHQLVAPPKKRGRGLGHRRHSVHRLRARELLGTAFGAALLAVRQAIERRFGNLTGFGGGLAPLPAWVRRSHRVGRWVQAKLLINGARQLRLEAPG